MDTKAVVLLSGGMDSTVMMHYLKNFKGIEVVRALAIHYGQRHRVELDHAAKLAAEAGIPFSIADLSSLRSLLGGSSQTDPNVPVPEGHYADETMRATVVPNRNMIMLSVAIGHAIACGASMVAYAAHSGDHAIYPDCRPEFVEALATAAGKCHYEPVTLFAPFVQHSKADICRLGHDLGVPLGKTWSCYKGLDKQCGRCGTCFERKEAFYLAGVPDPTEYLEEVPA